MCRAIGLLAFLAISWSAARADPVKSRSSAGPRHVTARLASHVRTIRRRRTEIPWAERQLRQIAEPEDEGQVAAVDAGPFGPAAAKPVDPAAESLEGLSLPADWRGGGEGGEGVVSDVIDSDGMGVGGIAEAAVDDAVDELPGFAFDVVDALFSYSDNARNLVFELKAAAVGRSFDWTSFFRNRRDLQSERTKKSMNRRLSGIDPDAQARARLEARLKRMRFRKVVRSLLKILIGVAIGLGMWMIVRRTASE